MYMFRVIWDFAQSADCGAQTEDQQNAGHVDLQFAQRNLQIAQIPRLSGTYTCSSE